MVEGLEVVDSVVEDLVVVDLVVGDLVVVVDSVVVGSVEEASVVVDLGVADCMQPVLEPFDERDPAHSHPHRLRQTVTSRPP
jgi:hypothetical protein